jgi:predicted PurR-regulated permease PerM
MLGISRKVARATWSAVIVLLILGLVYAIRKTIFVFIIALLFAYLISPLVNLLDRALPGGRSRGLALALAYVIFVGAVVLVGVEVGNRVVDQAQALSKHLPEMLGKWQAPSSGASPGMNDLKAQIINNVRTEIGNRANDLVHALPAAGVKLMSVASDLIFVVIVPILAFFFLKDGEHIRRHILELADTGTARARIDSLLEDAHRLLAHYMRALVLLALATFVSYSIFFVVVGVPFGVLLAVVAMFLEVIPMIGPLTAAVIILLVTAVSGGHFLLVAGFLMVYRLFQDYVLSPHLMGQGVELHPLIVLFGVFAGAEIAGVGGSFLSVPLLALVRILYLNLRRSRLAQTRPEPVLAESPMRQ